MRHQNEKTPAGGNRTEVFHQSTQQGESESALLATDRATFARIRELQAAQTQALSKEPPDVESWRALQTELHLTRSALSPSAIEYREAIAEARFDFSLRIGDAKQALAAAAWRAKRAGTEPADEAWQTYLNECRQAKEGYSGAVAKARAEYLADVARVDVQRGRGSLESHLAESFNGLDDDAALNRRDAA